MNRDRDEFPEKGDAGVYRRPQELGPRRGFEAEMKGSSAAGTGEPRLPAQSSQRHHLDWSDLAFTNKKPLNKLTATFIAAPREISKKRLGELIKAYLPQGNIILGTAKEEYIDGFTGQPQFRTLKKETIEGLLKQINAASPRHKVYTLAYFQREAKYLFEKLDFRRVILVRGSWHRSFHVRAEYYALVNHGTPYELVSPFVTEAEARDYAQALLPQITATLDPLHNAPTSKTVSETHMCELAADIARFSYDYSFQTGATLGKKSGKGYKFLASTYNKVVPFQTCALHYGASREVNFSPPNDLNFYDTTHAEVEMLIKAGREKIGLKGTTLFINLLPCPSCARMLSQTDIAEFVYTHDHSDGYAIKLLTLAGKKVRRITP